MLTERESQESEDERESEMVQSRARQDWNRNPAGLDEDREVHVIQSRRNKPSEGRLTASRGQETIYYSCGKPGLLHSKVNDLEVEEINT